MAAEPLQVFSIFRNRRVFLLKAKTEFGQLRTVSYPSEQSSERLLYPGTCRKAYACNSANADRETALHI